MKKNAKKRIADIEKNVPKIDKSDNIVGGLNLSNVPMSQNVYRTYHYPSWDYIKVVRIPN